MHEIAALDTRDKHEYDDIGGLEFRAISDDFSLEFMWKRGHSSGKVTAHPLLPCLPAL